MQVTCLISGRSKYYLLYYRRLVAVRNECQRRNRLGYDEVGLLAYCYRTEDIAHSHRVCGVDGAGVESLFRGEPHPDASQGHYESHVAAWTGAGL